MKAISPAWSFIHERNTNSLLWQREEVGGNEVTSNLLSYIAFVAWAETRWPQP